MPANRLSREPSPYLLQHAGNPVDWYPWGEEAFAKARREQKPILLSIGYSTCHWCHVMAHESFEDEGIAAFLNAYYVPVKVDREERPDIDHVYMTAVTAMTGQGGWPLTVFLTPDAQPFYGGTYFPPYAKWGAPGFMDLLKSIADAWSGNREQIVTSGIEITELLKKNASAAPLGGEINENILNTGARQMLGQMDPEHGGFGNAPKFPMGHNLSFLMAYHGRSADDAALHAVEQTLDEMARGGIYDHLGGGFHRYATDRKWHVPHFEKMLYDQALLVRAYTECYQATGNILYARIAHETLEYVLRDMTSPEGGFYCAEDADSEGYEGAFYVWTEKEIRSVLGAEEAEIFIRHYGVKSDGNVASDPHGEFTGKNILFLKEDVSADDELVLAGARARLFAARAGRPRPHLDDKVLADWNGLMIAAFAFAGSVFAEPRYIRAARRAADFILKDLVKDGRLVHRWRGGEASIDAMLEDHAFLAYGLVSLYEATFEGSYLKEAEKLADAMIARFADGEHGGFFMTASDLPGLIVRPQDIYDGALPSGNSVAAWVLMKLHYLTARDELRHEAGRSFKRFQAQVEKAPHAYAFFLAAFSLYLFPVTEITVNSTGRNDAAIANLRKVVYKHFMPAMVFKHVLSTGDWSVAVCRDGACLPPVSDIAALEKIIH